MNRFLHRVRGHGLWAVVAFMALGGISSSAFAQVEYVRELGGASSVGTYGPVLNITQAPGFYSATPTQTIVTQGQIYEVDSATGVVSSHRDLPDGILLAPNSIASIVGQGSTQQLQYLFSAQGDVLTVDPQQNTIVHKPIPSVDIFARDWHSMAAQSRDSTELSFIITGFDNVTSLTLVNIVTGASTATSVMSHLGTEAFYQSYGTNGLLYVLDYGNDRMVSFDPDNAFAEVGAFTLNSGVTTANEQFAIGANGNFYLGDGLGGGSTYGATGAYLNSFSIPEGTEGDAYTGASYLSTDSAGRVYVFDSATGFHQFQDTSVVPEPSTWALLLLGGGALVYGYRRQRNRVAVDLRATVPRATRQPDRRPEVDGYLCHQRRTQLPFKALLAMVALLGATPAFAQVVYERAIPVPNGATAILPIVQAPDVTGDPAVTNELPPLVDGTSAYWTLDTTSGVYSRYPEIYPPGVKLNANSKLAWLGQNSAESGPTLFAVTPQRLIITYDVRTDSLTNNPRISVDYDSASSIAARSLTDPISAILDSEHYTIDRLTGVGTLQPLAGVDTATTQFMSYGANGLLYVLDYGNSRIASFDPDNAFASVGSFTLQSGVTTANEQFAIGINGDFYLGDGLGGGSYYNSQGEFEGVFTLPGDATTSTYTGQSYLTTGADGSVYVYDKAYGFQQYQDMSVVPEPSTWALLLLGGGALVYGYRRRRDRVAIDLRATVPRATGQPDRRPAIDGYLCK